MAPHPEGERPAFRRFRVAAATPGVIGFQALVPTAVAFLLYDRLLVMAGAANLLDRTLMIPPVAILLGALLRNRRRAPAATAPDSAG